MDHSTDARPETEGVAPGTRYMKLLEKVEQVCGRDFTDELDQVVEDRMIEAEHQASIGARLEALEMGLDKLQSERRAMAKEVRTQRLVVATEDGYEGVVVEVDLAGADVTLNCPPREDQEDYTGIRLGVDHTHGTDSAGVYLSGAGNIYGSFDLVQNEDDAKAFDTWVHVSSTSSDGMRLDSDGVTVPPMRRHRESMARQVGPRLAAVEAQAERIAGKLERLLRLRGLQANVEGSMVDKMLQEPENDDDAVPASSQDDD